MSEIEIDVQKLLSDKRVIEEIQRHLWIESEKAGYDIGFEKAKEDWLKRFAATWMEYHLPEEFQKARKAAAKGSSSHKNIAASAIQEISKKFKSSFTDTAATVKRRRAKSYF